MTWEVAAAVLVYLMVPFATANPIMYAYVHDWRRSPEGRALMHLFVSFAALVDISVLYDAVPWFPGKPVVAVAIFAALLLGSMRFTFLLARELRAQRKQ